MDRSRARTHGLRLCLALGLAVSPSCVSERGGPGLWRPSEVGQGVLKAGPIDLFVLGGSPRKASTSAIATALAERVSPASTVLWLGARHEGRDDCQDPSRGDPALADLDASLGAASVFSVGNPRERFCGSSGPSSARSPDTHYLVDIGVDEPVVHTPCYHSSDAEAQDLEELRCPHPSANEGVQLRLLVVDETLWFRPEWDDESEAAKLELAQLNAIVDAIPENSSLPYLLVTHFPIESEGVHGLGGLRAQATYVHHPESVQRALAKGRIDGVIAGLEANLQYVDDLGLAVKRSSRVWLDNPVFQVVSGAAGDADSHHPGVSRSRNRDIALKNDRFSPHAGFVHLGGDASTLEVEVLALHGNKWRSSSALVRTKRPAHPNETPAPPLTPCRDCDPVQGAADGEKWERRKD